MAEAPTQYSISELPVEATTNHDSDLYEVTIDNGDGTFSTAKKKQSTIVDDLATESALAATQSDIDTHEADTSNPHGVTKAQVGLSQVPNTDATQRSNHSGTQTASTISDFQATVSVNTDVAANTTARHSHANKALLDTYDQTNTDITDAVDKKHEHANKSTLDATTASFTTAKDSKLTGIATGATANDTDANLKNRANHTGTQALSTISDVTASAAEVNVLDGMTATTTELNYVDGVTSNIQTQLSGKAATSHTHTASQVTDFNTAADARITAQKASANGLATLGADSKIPSSQLPAIAITNTFAVANQSAMLALDAQTGDVAVRTDQNKSYILEGSDPTDLSDWQELLTPTDAVQSVNGKTGSITLTTSDVAEGTNLYYPSADKTKLAGIASGATANSTDATLLNRANHTGTQAISTVSGLQTAIDQKQYKTSVTVGTADADYITDGTADHVQIQAALDNHDTVILKNETFRLSTVISIASGKTLLGMGSGKTILRYETGTVTATNMLGLASGTVRQSNITVKGITFDAQDQSNKGLINFNGVVTNLEISECELTNVGAITSSKWPLRIGTIIDADVDGSASFNVTIHHNSFHDNDCNTFEVILLPNVRDSWIHHNVFEGNNTELTDEVSIYGQNINVRYTDNIHKDWTYYAVGAKEGDQIEISNNTFTNSATSGGVRAIRLYNLVNSRCANNNITMGDGNQGYGIFLQDYDVGRDGHAQRNANTRNLDISGNILTNTYYGIANISTTNANHAFQNITVSRNVFYNCAKSPIRFGPNTSVDSTMDIQRIFVDGNVIHSWSGNIEGAISFYGDSADPTLIKDIYIRNNYVADNTTGGSSGAVRISAATAAEVRDNYLVSTGGYGPISKPNSGVVTAQFNNVGVDQVDTSGATNGQILAYNSSTKKWGASNSTSDVVGPASSTDNAVARFDSTTGKLLQNSSVTVGDTGAIATTVGASGNAVGLTVSQNDTTNNPRTATLNNLGTGDTLLLNSDGNGRSIYIDSEATSQPVVYIDAVNTGNAPLYVLNGAANNSSFGAVVRFQATNTGHTQPVIRAEQVGTGDVLFANQDGNGRGIYVDKDVTNANHTASSVQIDHTSVVTDGTTKTKTGAALQINSDVTETSGTITDSAQVLDINQTHGDATGNVVDISNAGTGISLNVAGKTVLQSLATALTTKTATYTITATDSIILADATSAAFTLTLPSAASITGRQYTIKRVNAGSNNITIGTTSSQAIDGSTTFVLTEQYQAITVVSNGSGWYVV